MLDENQGGQQAVEREATPAADQGGQPRDESGRFAPLDGEVGSEVEQGRDEAADEAKGEREETPDANAEERQEENKPAGDNIPPWLKRRLDRVSGQREQEKARADALEAELNRIKAARGETSDGSQAQAEQQVRESRPELTEDQVRAEAQKLRAVERFNEDCNRAFDEGKAKFSDFESRMQEFRHLGGLQQDFLEDVLAAGNSHAVLHHLAGDLDEADKIMSMTPRQRTAALVRLSDKLSAPPPPRAPSRAPAPIAPVAGAGRPSAQNTDPDSLSTEEWMRRRNAGEIR